MALLGAGFSKAAIAKEDFDNRLYVAPMASYIWTDEDRFSSRNNYGLALGVGKALNKNINLELKGFFNSFEHLSSENKNENQWKTFGSTLDLQYYFNRDRLSPYAVVGAGYMTSRVDGKSAGGFIGETGLGLAYKISDKISLRSDVRYRYNDNFDKHLVPNETTTYNEMIVNVGVVIPFGSAPSKAAAPAEKPAEKPVAQPAVQPAVPIKVSDDSDNDGVKNSADKCPDTKAGVKVNLVGCDMGITLTGVNFNFNSPAQTLNAKTILDKLADEIKSYPNKKDIEIQGHASSDGNAKHNMALSQKRAESVVNYLESRGVGNKLTAKGYGSTMPIADDATKAGRLQNRRVDMIWK